MKDVVREKYETKAITKHVPFKNNSSRNINLGSKKSTLEYVILVNAWTDIYT